MRGAARSVPNGLHRRFDFNPRARAGRGYLSGADLSRAYLFQSTRPVRGAAKLNVSAVTARVISIHAPVRGAAVNKIYVGNSLVISIHAPVRGAAW